MLVVGLGNPGPRYAGSPHNVGFRVLDHFAEHHAISRQTNVCQAMSKHAAWTQRFDAELGMASVAGNELVLLKPLTFMNRSGESVRKAMSFFKINEDQALVVHDELDLPVGSVKLKHGGGEAGHNGLKSLTAELGTRQYARLRVGVGRPAAGDVSDFLLAPMPVALASEVEASLPRASNAIELWLSHGLDRAMNLVNRRAADTGAADKPVPPGAGQPN
jgi:PTH1 family peptidyl-tRNA hydrolase